MAGRTDRRSRSPTDDAQRTGDSLAERATRVFSPKLFLLALVAFGVAFVAGNTAVPIVPVVGGLGGVAAVAFVLGLVVSTRRYLEVTVAGAVAAGLATWLNNLVLSVVGNVGVPIALVGAGGGVLAALGGYYLGRDLRDGLTRDL